jgi:hypothetical protein
VAPPPGRPPDPRKSGTGTGIGGSVHCHWNERELRSEHASHALGPEPEQSGARIVHSINGTQLDPRFWQIEAVVLRKPTKWTVAQT